MSRRTDGGPVIHEARQIHFDPMKNLGREAARDLLMLGFVAGSADAAGFLGAGHIFTSNMTGNLVLFGLACGQGQWGEALRPLYVLLMFVGGVVWGSRLVRGFSDAAWRRMMFRLMVVEASLLVLFTLGHAGISLAGRQNPGQFYAIIPFLAVAMGLQSAALNRLTIAGVTNTAVTGTLTNLAVGLESALFKTPAGDADVRRTKMQWLLILLYCSGAAANGVLMLRANWAAGIIPTVSVCLVALSHTRDD
jgi:uncharacterized membrane protein YoaK (UPF0700 family)